MELFHIAKAACSRRGHLTRVRAYEIFRANNRNFLGIFKILDTNIPRVHRAFIYIVLPAVHRLATHLEARLSIDSSAIAISTHRTVD